MMLAGFSGVGVFDAAESRAFNAVNMLAALTFRKDKQDSFGRQGAFERQTQVSSSDIRCRNK